MGHFNNDTKGKQNHLTFFAKFRTYFVFGIQDNSFLIITTILIINNSNKNQHKLITLKQTKYDHGSQTQKSV